MAHPQDPVLDAPSDSDLALAVGDAFARFGWSSETLDAHRTAALRRSLELARRTSPFYAERLAGLDIDRATIADLARVPPTTKGDLVNDFDRVIGHSGAQTAWQARLDAMEEPGAVDAVHVFASSGSSGRRALSPMRADDFVHNASALFACALGQSRHVTRTRQSCTVAFGGSNPAHLSAATAALFRALDPTGRTVLIPANTPISEIIDELSALDPTTLMGFGSVISRLARAQLAGQLDLGPEVVVSIGEPLPPEDDAVIGQAWGCPVHEGYGCSELGWLAMSTGTGGSMVHFDDQFVLEPLGADGSVLALGSDSTTVCVTTLARTGYPLIRYQLADRVRTLPPDPASGCGFTRIQSVLGRDDDWFRYGGIEIHPSTFRSALLTFPGIDEYQVVQTIDGAVVRAVASRTSLDTSVVAAAVAQALQRVGLQEPRVRVEYVTEIDRPAGQKLQRFVPLV